MDNSCKLTTDWIYFSSKFSISFFLSSVAKSLGPFITVSSVDKDIICSTTEEISKLVFTQETQINDITVFTQ